jgi:Zn-dependent protease
MGGGLRIGRILGIPIFLHPTWFIVFLLVTLGLGGQLAGEHPHWRGLLRWLVAGGTSLLFFGSILLHELGHSVLARRHRVAVRSITLFVFGGVALMERDPDSPRAEFEIAIAGPLVSALLALGFTLLARGLPEASAPASLLDWLVRINLGIALFNLLPGFPLDGGRVLRSILWARGGDALRATRLAAGAGQAIAYGFIGMGAVYVLASGDFSGLWLAFVGWFVLQASGATIRQAGIESSLRGLLARDVLSPDVAHIEASASVGRFARDLVLRGRRWALVQDEAARVLGIVSLSDVKRVSPGAWDTTPVREVATPAARLLTASLHTPVRELLQVMSTRDVNQIPIVEGSRIVGAVTRETLVHAIEMRAGGEAARLRA